MTAATWILAFATALLFIAAAFQVGLFWWQLRLIRESLADSKKAAEAAEKAANTSKDALVKLERPYIFVFDMSPIKSETSFEGEPEFFVEYSVANYGKMPAIIDVAFVGFNLSEGGDPTWPPGLADYHRLMVAPILQSGEKREKIREYIGESLLTQAIRYDEERRVYPVFAKTQQQLVFFRAIIRYHGPSSSGHETSALWIVDYPSVGFLAQRGEEAHNYTR